jgi:hypothetical protein
MSHQATQASSEVGPDAQAGKAQILEEALQVLESMPEWVIEVFVNRLIRTRHSK